MSRNGIILRNSRSSNKVAAIAIILFIIATEISAFDYSDYSLQRIARAPQQPSALLVPYPRVGKRSSDSDDIFDTIQKRLYTARVGKRAYLYAPRIGK
ncbi:unnamed protein product [Caenorhabditis angaria]|uniref:Uncharacterized protein n=1 Tax=Caenorhabditis angaria TaxID=860376 RepID=A0A9P1IY52_9PELO|nr:unnamed protein product [Caenorhabditis angaria]